MNPAFFSGATSSIFFRAAVVGAAAGAVVVTSRIFLERPDLLHSTPPYPPPFSFAEAFRPILLKYWTTHDFWGRPIAGFREARALEPGTEVLEVGLIGHRAAGGEAPENTIAAGKHAVEVGADMLQIDVSLTKDGQVIVFHDIESEHNMKLLTGVDAPASAINYKDLPPYLPEIPLNFWCRGGSISTDKFGPEGQRIPLLQDFLRATGQTPLYIELWDDKQELADKVWAIVEKCNLQDRVVLGSPFSSSITRKCLHAAPNASVMMPTAEWLGTYVLYYMGLLPFVPLRPQRVFNVALMTPALENAVRKLSAQRLLAGDWSSFTMYIAAHALLGRRMYAPPLFQHLRKRGMPVSLYVVNFPEELDLALMAGPDAIMTDFPSRIGDSLKQLVVAPLEDLEQSTNPDTS